MITTDLGKQYFGHAGHTTAGDEDRPCETECSGIPGRHWRPDGILAWIGRFASC